MEMPVNGGKAGEGLKVNPHEYEACFVDCRQRDIRLL